MSSNALAGRRRFSPAGALALVVAAAALSGCHRPEEHAQGGAGTASQDMTYGLNQTSLPSLSEFPTERPVLTDLHQVLSATNATALSDRGVRFDNVEVQRVFSRQFMLVGPGPERVVLVRLQEFNPELRPGDRVNVRGFITQFGQDLLQWNLTDADRAVLQGHTIFINATEVERPG